MFLIPVSAASAGAAALVRRRLSAERPALDDVDARILFLYERELNDPDLPARVQRHVARHRGRRRSA